MKNKKGEIATLLTLGLVIVGSLITLGTSLFVSNQKTNLASNSMAAVNCTELKCTTGNTNRTIYKRANGTFWSDPGCTGESGYGTLCGVGNGGVTMTPVPGSGGTGGNSGASECEHPNDKIALAECGDNNYTRVNCGLNSSGKQTYRCKTTGTSGSGNSGGSIVGEGQSCCFEKKGLVYVFATYKTMLDSDMLNDNGEVDCGRQSASVISSYQANKDKGAFVCPGGTQNRTPVDQFVPIDEEPTPGNSLPVAPKGCEKFPVGGCGMYRGTTRIKKTVEGVSWCCLSKKKVTPTPTLSANENVCEKTNSLYKCTAGGDAQMCQKKLNLSCGVGNTNQTCCDYNSGNRAVGTGTPQPLPSTADGEIGDCSKYVPDTCSNYCAGRTYRYSNTNNYFIKDKNRTYDSNCKFNNYILGYCGCDMIEKEGLVKTSVSNQTAEVPIETVQNFDSNLVGTYNTKDQAVSACSFCGGGLKFYNTPRCLITKKTNNSYQTWCGIN